MESPRLDEDGPAAAATPAPAPAASPGPGIARTVLSTVPVLALLGTVVLYRTGGSLVGAIPGWQEGLTEGEAAWGALEGLNGATNRALDALRPHMDHLLVVLLGVCAATVTALRSHISLRPVRGRLEDRVSNLAQLGAYALLLRSCVAKLEIEGDEQALLWRLWIATFGVLAAISGLHLLRPLPRRDGAEGLSRALLAVPLHAGMGLVAGIYFLAEGVPSGLAIYLKGITDASDLYVQVPLYVWAGLMLKRTRVVHRCFDLVRPLGLSPELLAALAVAAAAVPTAYSGASGIFVMAAGALVYDELRRSGASHSLAMASTAMSGSLGVVLRPCLLVYIVAMLSVGGDVSAGQLYDAGGRVFMLTASLFAVAVLSSRRGTLRICPQPGAAGAARTAGLGLLPAVALAAGVIGIYRWGLDTRLDEVTAPMIVPVAMLGLIGLDRATDRRIARSAPAAAAAPAEGRGRLLPATADTADLVGALLLLMAFSTCLGGVIQESGLVDLVPQSFASPSQAMGVLLVALVLIGMTMDPYGAVILVNATLKPVADANHLDPVHFWMVVLVAFELGYLTPPVALNQLLAWQVVGDRDEGAPARTIWGRHERYVLPIVVMVAALLAVAFVPFAWPGLLGIAPAEPLLP
ncbi:TRAP transporter large permease subunit [Myxococcota bacterium]|nr:TRAP transporter large permease subunit [Myxococcota bacterium]